MNVFESLSDIYAEIDGFYMDQGLQQSKNGDDETEAVIAGKRKLNDHAYFLFLFSRFEDAVREESSRLIRQNSRVDLDWEHRRVWQLLPSGKNADQPSFLDRVALLIDKRTHHYEKIKAYYKQRNTIGHGGDFTIPISISTVFSDLSGLLDRIKAQDAEHG